MTAAARLYHNLDTRPDMWVRIANPKNLESVAYTLCELPKAGVHQDRKIFCFVGSDRQFGLLDPHRVTVRGKISRKVLEDFSDMSVPERERPDKRLHSVMPKNTACIEVRSEEDAKRTMRILEALARRAKAWSFLPSPGGFPAVGLLFRIAINKAARLACHQREP